MNRMIENYDAARPQSSQLNELFGALAKAQGEMELASKTSQNTFFKSTYADLAQIIKASRSALVSNGLCVSQRILVDEGTMVLSTVLGHQSGQWIESIVPVNPPKTDVQNIGGYITYLKRYAYAALVGVATEDDDGESAMAESRSYRHKPQLCDPITKEQLEELEHELQDHPDLAKEVMSKMKLTSLSQMPKSKFITSINRIREIKLMQKP